MNKKNKIILKVTKEKELFHSWIITKDLHEKVYFEPMLEEKKKL